MENATPAISDSDHSRHRSTAIIGTTLGLVAAISYTACNICLRWATHCDPVWVSCWKAVPTLLIAGPWMLVDVFQGRRVVPPGIALLTLAGAAVIANLAGNVGFQWSLGIVGIALAVPVTLGSVMLGSTILGRRFLGEVVTRRMMGAMILLIAAISILSLGASDAHEAIHQHANSEDPTRFVAGHAGMFLSTPTAWHVPAGVAGVVLAGFAYALFGAVIRWSANKGATSPAILMTSCLVGVSLLGGIFASNHGWQSLWEQPLRDIRMALFAGVFNAIEFASLTAAIHMVGLVYVNGLNASQTAMAAFAGVLLFDEAITVWLIIGIALTAIGLMMIRGGHDTSNHVANRTR